MRNRFNHIMKQCGKIMEYEMEMRPASPFSVNEIWPQIKTKLNFVPALNGCVKAHQRDTRSCAIESYKSITSMSTFEAFCRLGLEQTTYLQSTHTSCNSQRLMLCSDICALHNFICMGVWGYCTASSASINCA